MRPDNNYSFAQVPTVRAPRSTFNRTHSHKTTFNQGDLVPFFVDEVLPGDTFSVSAQIFARLATPVTPFMDNLHCDLFFFYVPNRLVWQHWQNHMGEYDSPADIIAQTDYLTPQVSAPAAGFATGSVADYFGIPVGVPGINVNAMPFRAYNLIFNEWFRDQNLMDPATVIKTDGPDPDTAYPLRQRAKRHDYFTSALPWPQKGPGVSIPLGDTASVSISPSGSTVPLFGTAGGINITNRPLKAFTQGGGSDRIHINLDQDSPVSPSDNDLFWADPALSGIANLATATSATINSLRQAFQIQRLYERDARSGSRYTEILRAHFGVVSPDARLQRPEYLGGTSNYVHVTPIAQTSASGTYADTPQGNLAAMGTLNASAGFTKSFVEHGHIIGLLEVRPDINYSQGLHRMWSRRTRFDFYWPVLAHLGEQAILNKEIYCQGTSADDTAFGYQERWAEYKYSPGKITGLFRHNPTTGASLDVWHLAQEFLAMPTLNAQFLSDKTDTINRVIAVENEPHFLMDSMITCRTTRPMPTYSVPGMIDHF